MSVSISEPVSASVSETKQGLNWVFCFFFSVRLLTHQKLVALGTSDWQEGRGQSILFDSISVLRLKRG